MKSIEATLNNGKHLILRHNIEYAVAAGFSTAFPLYFLMKSEAEHYEIGFPLAEDIFLLALLPSVYLIAAVLLWLCRDSAAGRRIPHWLAISIIGSQMFFPLLFLYAAIVMHQDLEFITADRLLYAGPFALGLNAYTLMWTAAVRYAPSLIAAVKTRAKKS
jgi:hypothetical protein